MGTYQVVFEPGLIEMLHNGGERAQSIMRAGTADIARQFVENAVVLAGGDGPYPHSFSATPDGDDVTAGSKSPMAGVLERGRKSGLRPPPASIRKRRGGSYAAAAKAADKIAQSGSRGRYVVKKAAAQVRHDGTIDRVCRRVVEAVAHGGIDGHH